MACSPSRRGRALLGGASMRSPGVWRAAGSRRGAQTTSVYSLALLHPLSASPRRPSPPLLAPGGVARRPRGHQRAPPTSTLARICQVTLLPSASSGLLPPPLPLSRTQQLPSGASGISVRPLPDFDIRRNNRGPDGPTTILRIDLALVSRRRDNEEEGVRRRRKQNGRTRKLRWLSAPVLQPCARGVVVDRDPLLPARRRVTALDQVAARSSVRSSSNRGWR